MFKFLNRTLRGGKQRRRTQRNKRRTVKRGGGGNLSSLSRWVNEDIERNRKRRDRVERERENRRLTAQQGKMPKKKPKYRRTKQR